MSVRLKHRGFTLLETLVAVAIMGLVAVGSLKLAIISQKTLAEVAVQREFIDRARELRVLLLKDDFPDGGEREGLKWRVRTRNVPVLGGAWSAEYRTVDIEYRGRRMNLFAP